MEPFLFDMTPAIIPFEEIYADAFAELNFAWLEKYFYIEDYDREVLTKPQEYILSKGGYIFLAKLNGEVVGTVALIFRGESEGFELSKMAVAETLQGKKIGQLLMDYSIQFAKDMGAKRIYLDSNRKLTPAITLYQKVGFKEIPVPKDTPYERCNIRMEMRLM